MGCCENKNNLEVQEFWNNIQQAIRRDAPERLNMLLSLHYKLNSKSKANINSPVLTVNSYIFNLLSFSVWQGSHRSFKCLYEKHKASLKEMEKNLSNYNLNALNLILAHKSIELLKYFLPIYVEQFETFEESLSASMFPESQIYPEYTPVQEACEAGDIAALSVIYNYFIGKSFVPQTLDIEYQEKLSGENCVLIACRTLDYQMIRFLHTKTSANFNVTNKKGEDPITVLFISNKSSPKESFLNCLTYLVESVNLDIVHIYENLLLLALNMDTVNYLYSRLGILGICINKQIYLEKFKNKFRKSSYDLNYLLEPIDLSSKLKETEVYTTSSDSMATANDNILSSYNTFIK